MAVLVGGLGVLSQLIFNRMRRRPALFQPWWHVALGAGGGYFGYRIGLMYDDVAAAMDTQHSLMGRNPSWATETLSPAAQSEGHARCSRRAPRGGIALSPAPAHPSQLPSAGLRWRARRRRRW